MSSTQSLEKSEVEQLVADWYHALDVHAPAEDLLPMLATNGLEMKFPEATLYNQSEFIGWYEGVIRRFFDEIHTMKELTVNPSGDSADVKLVVNWQCKIWDPPAPKSTWLGFDAAQTWTVTRSPESGKAVIQMYQVDALDPMEGSASL